MPVWFLLRNAMPGGWALARMGCVQHSSYPAGVYRGWVIVCLAVPRVRSPGRWAWLFYALMLQAIKPKKNVLG